MKTIIYFLLIVFISVGCRDKKADSQNLSGYKYKNTQIQTNKISLLDSTIYLSGISHSTYQGSALTKELAKQVLYDFYKKKGNLIETELKGDLSEIRNGEINCVYFDTLYFVNLNGNKFKDGIISYWLCIPYSSGHCLMPQRAIIADSDKGYTVTNEKFILSHFIIDSLSTVENRIELFGYEYECANDTILQNFRFELSGR